MASPQAGQLARHVGTALVAGALGGYLAALLRPRGAEAYASTYAAPYPNTMAHGPGATSGSMAERRPDLAPGPASGQTPPRTTSSHLPAEAHDAVTLPGGQPAALGGPSGTAAPDRARYPNGPAR